MDHQPQQLRPAFPGSLALLAVLALLLTGAPSAGAQSITDDEADYLDVEVATVGVDLRSGAPLAVLHQNWERVVPIFIGDAEAQAIARAREEVRLPRPMTHDLMTSVIETLGGTLEEVRVHDLREGTYLGALRIRVEGEIQEVDSRPSDALALAVRTGARIRVIPRLAEEAPDVDFLSLEADRAIARIRGVTVTTPSERDRDSFGIVDDREGALVLHVGQAIVPRGVRRGDLIVSVAGRTVRSALDFAESMTERDRSSTVTVHVIRDGEERELEVGPERPPGRVS